MGIDSMTHMGVDSTTNMDIDSIMHVVTEFHVY